MLNVGFWMYQISRTGSARTLAFPTRGGCGLRLRSPRDLRPLQGAERSNGSHLRRALRPPPPGHKRSDRGPRQALRRRTRSRGPPAPRYPPPLPTTPAPKSRSLHLLPIKFTPFPSFCPLFFTQLLQNGKLISKFGSIRFPNFGN